MRTLGGRTPEQWAAYDRGKRIGSIALALLLAVLWLAGRGPGRAAGCCGPPAPLAAAAQELPAAPPPTPVPEPGPDCAEAMSLELRFATNSAELTPEDRAELDGVLPCLAEGRFEIGGHTDASGNDAINVPLSEARARAVVAYLASRGVDAGRLTARGYGAAQPVADNATPEGRSHNRRVELRRE